MSDVQAALDAVRARCDVAARREADPVGFAHRYDAPEDRELVGARGGVHRVRQREGHPRQAGRPARAPRPAPGARRRRSAPRCAARLRGWKHRVFRGRGRRAAARRRARASSASTARSGARFARELAARDGEPARSARGLVRRHPRRRAVCARTERGAGPRTSCPTRAGRAAASASSSTCAGWSAPPTASTSASGTSTPRVCSSRSTSTSTASRATWASPAVADSPGGRPRRSPRRWRASTPRDPVGVRLLPLPHGHAPALPLAPGRRPLRGLRRPARVHPLAQGTPSQRPERARVLLRWRDPRG